jgi:hypothetical protein
MRIWFISTACVAVLAGTSACNSREDGAAEPAASNTQAALVNSPIKGPKPGKWQVTTSIETPMGSTTLPPSEICITKEELEYPQGVTDVEGGECSVSPLSRQGDAIVGTSVCQVGGTRASSELRMTGDFNQRYTTEVVTRMDPPPTPQMTQTRMSLVAQRLGDC